MKPRSTRNTVWLALRAALRAVEARDDEELDGDELRQISEAMARICAAIGSDYQHLAQPLPELQRAIEARNAEDHLHGLKLLEELPTDVQDRYSDMSWHTIQKRLERNLSRSLLRCAEGHTDIAAIGARWFMRGLRREHVMSIVETLRRDNYPSRAESHQDAELARMLSDAFGPD